MLTSAPLTIRIDQEGHVFVGNKFLGTVEQGEQIRLESKSSQYNIIIHRKPARRAAKIIKLADRRSKVTP